jgi:dUTPase|tara:strand:+ start:3698 stop:3877 length:180 start_codon:yes stop_codon:yes gene_type:complete
MTFFNLPKGYKASITEGTINHRSGFTFNYQVTIKNPQGLVEETALTDTIEDCIQILSSY